jgi:uncharacterized protein (TIGR00299 family) protein
MRGGLAATKVDVIEAQASHEQEHGHAHADADHKHDHGPTHKHVHAHTDEHVHQHAHAAHRALSTILRIIAEADLSPRVQELSSRAFQLLGAAEAAIHNIPVEQVHFHEVGAVDTIVDLVCTAAGVEWLNVDRWIATALNVGSGTVKCQHGTLPVPAPATLALIGNAPVYSAGFAMERVTPTGATVLRMIGVEYQPMPAMRVLQRGYGAGGRDVAGEPNLLRLLVGETTDPEKTQISPSSLQDLSAKLSPAESEDKIGVITTLIDDSSPQLVAWASEQLLAAGAWDVYRAAVQMKKSRAGVELTVLCKPALIPALAEILFSQTTTIGLHWRIENKIALQREFVSVVTEWGLVSIKVARLANGCIANASPEFEDCRMLAEANSVPLKLVMNAACQAFAARNTKEY